MKSAARTLLAVFAGFAVATILIVAVEWFSSVVHPFPAGFDQNDFAQVCAHVQRYPHWVLAVVVLAWSATATASTWVASRIGHRIAGGIVGLMLAALLISNLAMLPYTMWFKVVMPVALAVACLLGIRYCAWS